MGFRNTHIGLGPDHADCYDPLQLDRGRRDAAPFRAYVPLAQSVKFIRPGEIAWTHDADPAFLLGVADFRKLFIRREVRALMLSDMRWNIWSGRVDTRTYNTGKPKADMVKYLRLVKQQLRKYPIYTSLLSRPDVCCVRFEDIVEKRIELCNRLADFLGGRHITITDIEDILNSSTLTKQPHSASIRDYWSDEAEALFEAYGGRKLNAAWGYD